VFVSLSHAHPGVARLKSASAIEYTRSIGHIRFDVAAGNFGEMNVFGGMMACVTSHTP
jgi:hypothetical protein